MLYSSGPHNIGKNRTTRISIKEGEEYSYEVQLKAKREPDGSICGVVVMFLGLITRIETEITGSSWRNLGLKEKYEGTGSYRGR